MSLKKGITIVIDTEDHANWYVRYDNKDYYHPTPDEMINLREFCNKNNDCFYLGFGPFCLTSGADINGNFEESIERF
ncbi:hypothetical protein LCGC14_1732640, partial [marine sediment metagenome]